MKLHSTSTNFQNILNGLLCLFCVFSTTLTNAQTTVAGPCGTSVAITNASNFTAANGSISISNITGANVYAYWNSNFTTAIINGSSYSNPTVISSIVAGTYPLYFKVFNADFSTVLCEETKYISVGPTATCADFPEPTFTVTHTTSTPCTNVQDGTITVNNLSGPAQIIKVFYDTQEKIPVNGSVTFTGAKKGFSSVYVGYYDSQYKSYCTKALSLTLNPIEPCLIGCANDLKAHNYAPTANSNAVCLTCNDGIQNGDETAVDCGGKHCEPCCAADKIAGSVYLDNNQDGEKGIHESKMPNITVTAFDENNQVAQTTTGTDGTYAFTGLTAGKVYRIEFTNIPSYASDGVYGSKSGTSVQFVSPNSCSASLGLINAGDYCQAKPDVVTTIFSNGNQTGTGSGIRSVVKSPYGNQGAYDLSTVLPITTQATAAVTGAVYGVAYHRPTKKYITSAYLKRHSGFGPLGVGGLYVTDIATSATSNFVDLGTLGASLGTDPHSGLPSDVTQPSLDATTFANVSKLGIGDIDFSDDGNDLFAVNMNTRELIKMNVGQTLTIPASVTNYAITNPGCPNGDFRPFALKYNHGKIYIGVTCSAETSQTQSDLSAKVISFDPNNAGAGFATVLDFPLTYTKGYADSKRKSYTSKWYPWVDSWNGTINRRNSNSYPGEIVVNHPSPLLTDIEFDVDNSMIVGIRDRFGDQVGFRNYAPTHTDSLYQTISGGDILRAGNCNFGATWTIENDATVCTTQTIGKDTIQGPGGGEYYWGDFFNSGTKIEHADISNGSLAFAPGSGEILATGLDLILPFTGGVYSLNNQTGARGNSLEVYDAQRQYLGKSNGIGDVEVLCNVAPIEIGNRVFMDTDEDGIQDPNEMGLDGVMVELWKAGVKVTGIPTANGGQYIFTNVLANMDYEIKILATSFPVGKQLTPKDATSNGQIDLADSDAELISGDAVIKYKTGGAGQNNHTLDFGFKAACLLTAGATGANVKCNLGTDGTATVTAAGNIGAVTYLWSNLATTAAITGLAAGTYTVTVTETASCTATASYIVTEPTAMALDCTKTDATTVGGSEGTATVAASGGTTAYTYLWSNGSTTATISGLAAGTYMVTVTDANLCSKVCESIVNAPGCNLTASANGTNAKCNLGTDGTATATAAGNIGAVTYLWSNLATTATITGLAAGTYTVTVTETASCTATASYVVTEPTVLALMCAKTDATTVGGSEGTATVTASGGTAGYTYLWSNGATTATISGLAAGTYMVTVTDANLCSKVCESIVNAPGCNLTASANGTNAKCNLGTDGTATVTAAGNVGAVTYLWSNGATSAAITGLSAGTYTVTVTETASCTATASYIVTEPTVLALMCTKTDATTVGGSEGTATVTASGGTAGYTYLWSNGATIATISGLAAGTYTVTVTDANLCSKVCESIVNAPGCNLTATANGTNAKCNLGTDGTATVTAAGNIGAVTYLWSNLATTATITGLMAGTYTVTVTETASCTATASYIVTEPTALALMCTKSDATTVGGSEGTATVTASGGTAGYNYLWSNGATTATISGLVAGTYTVTVTDANLCSKVCESIVNAPGCNLTATATGTNAKCNAGTDGTATATAAGNVGAVTYLWSNLATTAAITGLSAGIYTVTVTETTSCTATASYVVTAPTVLALMCAKTDATTVGGSEGTATVTASGGTAGYTYLWSNGATTATISGLAAGTYMVTVTDANLCSKVCSSIVTQPTAATCNLLDGGVTVTIDQKGTSSTADDEYVIYANPTGTGLAATYNVSGDINKTGVAYGALTEIGRTSTANSTISYVIEDGADANCSLADAAFNLNANTCILKANPTVLCNDNGTPSNPSDDTFSVSLNPTGNGIGTTYNVTGGITASNIAYGSAQQIATGLLISAGAVTITVKDATTANCELINIRIDPPAPCSAAVVCPPKVCAPVKLVKN